MTISASRIAQFIAGLLVAAAVLVFGLPALLYLLGGGLLVVPWRPRARRSTLKPTWQVKVCSATKYNADRLSTMWGDKYENIDGETSVRLVRGSEMHPIGIAKVAEPNFEEQLQNLVAIAEERAATLNAYADGLM